MNADCGGDIAPTTTRMEGQTPAGIRRWSRNMSAQRLRELERFNQIERRRQYLELRSQNDLFDQMSPSVNGQSDPVTVRVGHENEPSAPTGIDQVPNVPSNSVDDVVKRESGESHRAQPSSDASYAHIAFTCSATELAQSTGNKSCLTSLSSPEETSKGQHRAKGKDLESADTCARAISGGLQYDKSEHNGHSDPRSLNRPNESATLKKVNSSKGQLPKNSIGPSQLSRFVATCVPKNKRVLCLIVRDKMSRFNKAKSYFYPTYYLFIQAILDVDEQFASDLMMVNSGTDDEDLSASGKARDRLDKNALASAENSFSASSSISADMMFIGSNGQQSAHPGLVGNSYSDNEAYVDTETDDDYAQSSNGPTNTDDMIGDNLDGKERDLVSSRNDKCGRDNALVFPDRNDSRSASSTLVKTNTQRATGFDSRHDSSQQQELAKVSPVNDSNEDDGDSDHDVYDLRQTATESNRSARLADNQSSRTEQVITDEDIQSGLFDNERNPYTGTYGVLLAGRRRKKAKTYMIGPNEHGFLRKNSICKLKSNVLGTQFNAMRLNRGQADDRCNIASVSYETNVLGFKGPRKMRVLLAKDSTLATKNLSDMFKRDPSSVSQLKNMTPSWNVESQSYVLNFHGRVTQASVKNFQLVECDEHRGEDQRKLVGQQEFNNDRRDLVAGQSADETTKSGSLGGSARFDRLLQQQQQGKNDTDAGDCGSRTSSEESRLTSESNAIKSDNNESIVFLVRNMSALGNKGLAYNNSIVMQFGRISSHEFTCDVTYPLSILQAFAIALSSFDSKLACE